MSQTDAVITYRLRRVSPFVKQSQLFTYLTQVATCFTQAGQISVHSFAPTIGDWNRPPYQTATISFERTPEQLKDGREEWSFPVGHGQPSLLLDKHFLDFTALNDVHPDEHTFDCIAVSGLASHAFGSWKQRDASVCVTSQPGPAFMWLRDQLPLDLPGIRVLIYGYDTTLINSHSFQDIDDIAVAFIRRLSSVRPAGLCRKPLVLLAHSLGGIVLKSAMLRLAGSGEYHQSLLKDVKCAFFFGVPSKGMHISHLMAMVEDQPNGTLIRNLSAGSDYLLNLGDKLSGISLYRSIRLISAYETETSATVVRRLDGKWAREGKHEILVTRDSAIQTGSDPDDIFPINRDHSNMVKFSPNDPSYLIVSEILRQITDPHEHGVREDTEPDTEEVAEQPNMPIYNMHDFRAPEIQTAEDREYEHFLIDKLVQSLKFEEQDYRLREIEKAHTGTLDWIFDSELDFMDWLRKPTGFYWIRGKPGSGKSTLMKYLHEDERCSKYLRQWTPGRELVSAWFFFHDRGSSLQKSWEGLLRSIIYQLVSSSNTVARMVLPFYRSRSRLHRGERWHLHNLELALTRILEQQDANVDIVLFLDALDEYDDPPELIAEALRDMGTPRQPKVDFLSPKKSRSAGSTRIKICFSSRPWDVFVKNFNNYPSFYIHEKTEGDIRKFVVDQILELQGTGAVLDGSLRSQIDTIVARAEGVFLWVRLVLERVQKIYRKGGTSLADVIERQLEALPDKLEDLYNQTLYRIADTHRREAFIILEIIYRSPTIMTVEQVYLAAGCGQYWTYTQCRKEVLRRQSQKLSFQDMGTHLKNLCGGLLEIIETDEKPRIQFIHRTAKDFVGKPECRQKLFGAYDHSTPDNGFSTLFKFYMSIMVDKPKHEKIWVENSICDAAMEAAFQAEMTTGIHQTAFLDSVPRDFFETIRDYVRQPTGLDSAFKFAICAGLRLYVLNKLNEIPIDELSNPYSGIPVLHAAVQWILFRIFGLSSTKRVETAGVVRLLLDGGVRDVPYKGLTAFSRLFQGSLEGPLGTAAGDFPVKTRIMTADMIKAFVETGQDPDVPMLVKIGCPSYQPQGFGHGEDLICRPLHLSRSPMTEALIEGGANVNALDSGGRTPLDIAYGCCYGGVVNLRAPEEMVATVKSLLAANANVTSAGIAVFPAFIDLLYKRAGFSRGAELTAAVTHASLQPSADAILHPFILKYPVMARILGKTKPPKPAVHCATPSNSSHSLLLSQNGNPSQQPRRKGLRNFWWRLKS